MRPAIYPAAEASHRRRNGGRRRAGRATPGGHRRAPALLGLVTLALIFGMGHHVDHLLRGNHVGWPVTPQVTPFTYSLGFYPLILIGLALARRDRVGPAFWAALGGAGLLFVGLAHFGPLAVERPRDILDPYAALSYPAAGWVALGWLVTFLLVLGTLTLYSGALWLRGDRARPGGAERESRLRPAPPVPSR